jgi:hypothetical protein
MLISKLRRALQETADQATVNMRTALKLEVRLRKELLKARHRLAELEPACEMFIEKHNDEEEARDQEQRRRAAVTAQPSERRIRESEDVSNRVELRLSKGNPPADSAADISRLATPCGAENVLSTAIALGSVSTLPRDVLASVCWS